MNTKHTPGPWNISSSMAGWQIRGADGSRIFHIDNGTIPTNDDARLIAFAPDLLAALAEVTRCLEWHERRHGVGMDAKALNDARAAISRARGEG